MEDSELAYAMRNILNRTSSTHGLYVPRCVSTCPIPLDAPAPPRVLSEMAPGQLLCVCGQTMKQEEVKSIPVLASQMQIVKC